MLCGSLTVADLVFEGASPSVLDTPEFVKKFSCEYASLGESGVGIKTEASPREGNGRDVIIEGIETTSEGKRRAWRTAQRTH
jgi:hypothetical protein